MKRIIVFYTLLLFAFSLIACKSAQPPIYEQVSDPALLPGDTIPSPVGEVILTVDGKISQTNVDNTLQFDLETLEKLGVVQYDVTDPFVKEKVIYGGILVSKLLEVSEADSKATMLTLWALDDYSVDLSIADVDKWPILIATRSNDAPIPLDQYGPLISIVPFDDFPEIDHLTYDSMWVWALAKITVK